MQRRDFSRSLLGVGALVAGGAGALVAVPAQAQIGGFKDGNDYVRLKQPAPVDAPAGQIEVLEFFAYTCPHCFHFEPMLQTWLKQKPANIVFKRVPVFFEPFQRAYYALEAMGQLDTFHEKLFALFHVDHAQPEGGGKKPEAMADWAAKAGVDRAKFLAAYNSFGVVGKAKRASQIADAYQVEGTPAMGIAGRFMVPGQAERTLPIVNALIADVRKG